MHRRDASLTVGLLLALVAVSRLTVGVGALVTPAAVGVGVGGALVVEAAFLRYPGRLLAVWERPGVAVTSAGLVFALAVAAVLTAPWLLGAAVWGLLTYLLLLGCVLVGVGNPLAAVVRPGGRE